MTPDVNVKLINFPNAGKEMVVPNEDGSYTILINAKLCYEDQVKAYEHAMRHITEHDFEKEDVQSIEYHAHLNAEEKAASNEIQAKYEEALKKIRARRRSIQRQMTNNNKKIQFLEEHGLANFFAQSEQLFLYDEDH